MNRTSLTVALISELFFDESGAERLRQRCVEARQRGADLAVLPELPIDPWVPATRASNDGDTEEPGGRRQRIMASAASAAGIAILGGAIISDPATGSRHNTACLFDADGELLAAYRKLHLPSEPDFWESDHYQPGTDPPRVVTGLSLTLGIQICSDANRTSGCQLLAAQGAEAIMVPRATPTASWPRWRLVLCADAVTSAAWVVSVNRPPEGDPSPIGGPSAVIAPDGEVVHEAVEPLAIVDIDRAAVDGARAGYPGYLDFQNEVYARGWSLADRRS